MQAGILPRILEYARRSKSSKAATKSEIGLGLGSLDAGKDTKKSKLVSQDVKKFRALGRAVAHLMPGIHKDTTHSEFTNIKTTPVGGGLMMTEMTTSAAKITHVKSASSLSKQSPALESMRQIMKLLKEEEEKVAAMPLYDPLPKAREFSVTQLEDEQYKKKSSLQLKSDIMAVDLTGKHKFKHGLDVRKASAGSGSVPLRVDHKHLRKRVTVDAREEAKKKQWTTRGFKALGVGVLPWVARKRIQVKREHEVHKYGGPHFGYSTTHLKKMSEKKEKGDMKARLTRREKVIITTMGAKRAAARGAEQVLTAIESIVEPDERVSAYTRRHMAALQKLRGPRYVIEKKERIFEMKDEAEKKLEEEKPVDMRMVARLANFGGTFLPEIYEFRPQFDPLWSAAEKKIKERFDGEGVRQKIEEEDESSTDEELKPIFDSWDARMRGNLKAGFKLKDVKEYKELLRRYEAGESLREVREELARRPPPDVCPARVCENRPCRRPQPRPPHYKREFPSFPQYNSCVLVGNWVEDRRCFVRKIQNHFSIYSFDYRKPAPTIQYSKYPYYANMFSHRGVPYDVLFSHGTLPPPRRWTTECSAPCQPCCQPISCVTESRANYAPPPKNSYIVCRRATPKVLSSSFEPISRNIYDLHLRGEQLNMLPPTQCY